MTPNIQLLINCCKTNQTDSDIKQIREYVSQLNFHELSQIYTLTHHHGVFPLYYQTIQMHASDLLSTEINEELKQQNLTIVMRNMRMTAELTRIMNLLKENGIDALAFKGPTLAQLAYGDIALRQYVDLDIIVKKEDIYNVDALLKNKGYQRVLKLTSSQEKTWFKYAHDILLFSPSNGVHFEIHWSLLDQDYPVHINLDTIWKNSQFIAVNDQEIPTFSTEDLLLYLCIHGSKHLWERIEWIKDIDLLLQTQDINWGKVIKETEDSDFETMFYLGLYLTYILFETQLPKSIRVVVTKNKKLVDLTDFIFKRWQNPNTMGISKTIQQTTFMLKLFPTLSMRLSYLHKIILKPSLNEYWFVDLPNNFYWLYYLIRPYLLFKKYLFTKKR